MSKETACMKKTSIGGQALIEGVMMRGPQKTAMAVRHTSGEIRTDCWDNPVGKRPAITKWPLVRGIFTYVDSMKYGYKCLMKSVEMSGMEEELEEAMTEENAPAENAESAETAAAKEIAEQPSSEEKKKSSALMNAVMVVGAVLGVVLSLVLFIYLPSQIFDWLTKLWTPLDNRYIRGIFEGLLRILIFLGYMVAVSRMKDIRRTFQYHGAEHKTIFCYEKGLPLTVENVRMQSRFHPRCGTSFLVLMLVVGIVISILIPIPNPILRTVIKLALLPVTVGIGYELIKLAGRKDNFFTRIISAPGLWVQRLTTIEPEDDMIECAIESLKMVIPEDPEADKW